MALYQFKLFFCLMCPVTMQLFDAGVIDTNE